MSLAHVHMAPALPGMRGAISNAWTVLWSLSVEEYYYLLWAPVVLWMARRRAVISGIAICLLALAIRWLGSIGSDSYFSIYHRFDAPVFGSLLAFLIASKIPRRAVDAILGVAGLAGAATLAVVLVPMGNVLGRDIKDDHSFIVFGLPSLSLVAATAVGISVINSGSPLLFFLRLGALRFFGKISYTLYLLHSFVYLCFLHFFTATWAVSLAAILCAVTLSWISWTYLEQPILAGGREDSGKAGTGLKLASAA